MFVLLRRLGGILAMIALLAVPLSEAAIMGPPLMVLSMSTGSKMNCTACDQSSAGFVVCSAYSCAIFGILAGTAISTEKGRAAFFVSQTVAPEELALTPPTPLA